MHRSLAGLILFFASAVGARAEAFDIITFHFPVTVIPNPISPTLPPDVVSALDRSFTLPASPTPITPPIVLSPESFWIDPCGNPPGAFPPPGDTSFYFSPNGEGFVSTQSVAFTRAYFRFQSQQLFTGPVTAPTFLLGTFAAQYAVPIYGFGYDFGTITIAAADAPPSPVPEPSSLLLFASGSLGFVSVLRRRLR